ncbi:hypothetical protein Golob_025546 [Gossypium lobatum]|uniref:Pentatricopeptide repeat-containing protein n=1 Tax=Gossypium lobatum TaxID=34289 RepID=A0A7J8LSM2_9ROSI|nr:hypothetical protein [Gossypium lobatum]
MSLGLLDEVRKIESLPVIPLYRMLSNSFIKAGRLEAALQLHQELASFSRVSTAYYSTCNALIESLSLAGKVNEAFELYSDMTRMGGVPEISTFIHLIRGLITVNKWEEALQLSDSFCQMFSLFCPVILPNFLLSSCHYGLVGIIAPNPTPQNNSARRNRSYSPNLLNRSASKLNHEG